MSVPLSAVALFASGVLTFGSVLVSPEDPLEQYEFIAGLSSKGLHEQVVREATRFLEEHPRHDRSALVRYHLGGALFEFEDTARTKRARDEYKQLAQTRGFEFAPESALRAGQCELRLGAPGAATPYFKAVRSSNAEYLHSPATRLLGEALFEEGKFGEAKPLFAEVASKGEPELALDAAHGLAWCEFRLGEHERCLNTVKVTLKRFPKDPLADELRFLRAESLFESGRSADAERSYLEVGPGAFREASLRGAAFAAAEQGDHARAAAAFDALLREAPTTRFREEALLHRGIHYLEAGEAAAARESLKTLKPTAEGLFWLGRALDAEGRGDKALDVFERGLQLAGQTDPQLRERIQLARAELLSKLGREEEATRAYESAGSDYALHAAAVAKLNAGEPEEAIRLASSVAERSGPFQIEAQFVLGEGHFALKRFGPAEAAFGKVAQSPESESLQARATSRIAWCRYLEGDHSGAANAFARVWREHSKSEEAEEALFMQARSQEDASDSAGAAQSYSRYLEHFAEGARCDEANLRLAGLESDERGLARLISLVQSGRDAVIVKSARKQLADRLAAKADYMQAALHYRALVDAGRDDEACYGLAWCLYSSGDAEGALRQLEALDHRDTESELRVAGFELGVWAARSTGRMEAAQESFWRLVEACDDDSRLMQATRVMLEGWRESDRAVNGLRQIDRMLEKVKTPEIVLELCVERGHISLGAGSPQEAEAVMRAALKRDPQHAGLLELAFFVGEARYRGGEKKASLELFALAASSPQSEIRARAHYMTGFVQLEEGANTEAATSFAALVADHAESELFGETLYLLGEAYYRAGSDRKAIEVLKRHRKEARRHATSAKALFRLGLAQARSEQFKDANRSLTELVTNFPEFPSLNEAELARGRSLASLGKPRAARQSFERVIASDKGVLSARARLGLGGLHEDAGDLEAALSEFLKVAVLYAQDEEVAEALFRAGGLLEQQGETAQARKQYEELLKDHAKSSFAERAQQRLNRIRQENAE